MDTPARLAAVDLTDLDNFADGFPHDLFALHRRAARVFWHEPTENTPDGEGVWSVATYPETLEVLRDPVTYWLMSPGNPTRIWVSDKAFINVSARTWPGWSCGCCSRNCCRDSSAVSVVEPAEWMRSNRHNGIRHLMVEIG